MKVRFLNPFHYLKVAKQLVTFIITPLDQPNRQLKVSDKILGTWTVFVIKMVATIVVSLFVGLIYDPVNQTSARHSYTFSPLMLVLVAVILLPLLEEIAFRLSLRFKPIYLSLTAAVFAYYITTKGVYSTNLSNVTDHFTIRILVAGLILISSYSIVSMPKVRHYLEGFWKANFRWVFYSLCLCFALVHLFNYDQTLWLILLFPLIILSKLIGALCYGFIRIQYGFIYSIGLHFCWNALGVIMTLIPAVASD